MHVWVHACVGVHAYVGCMHVWGACICGVHACVWVHPCVGYMHVWVHACVGNGQVLAVGLLSSRRVWVVDV